MNAHMMRGLLICGLILMATGCDHYYRVTDPGSGKTYYTTDIDERGGRIKMKDERTKSTVMLAASEVSEISKEEYEAEVKGTSPTVTPSVATQSPVPTQSPD